MFKKVFSIKDITLYIWKYFHCENFSNAGNSFWIGGSDWTVEGKWVWEPLGIKFNYTNFADGRPNNYHGENCLSIRAQNHQWDDDDCDEQRRYLCEKRQAKLHFLKINIYKTLYT